RERTGIGASAAPRTRHHGARLTPRPARTCDRGGDRMGATDWPARAQRPARPPRAALLHRRSCARRARVLPRGPHRRSHNGGPAVTWYDYAWCGFWLVVFPIAGLVAMSLSPGMERDK